MPAPSDLADALELQRLRGVIDKWDRHAEADDRCRPYRVDLHGGPRLDLRHDECWVLVQGMVAAWESALRS